MLGIAGPSLQSSFHYQARQSAAANFPPTQPGCLCRLLPVAWLDPSWLRQRPVVLCASHCSDLLGAAFLALCAGKLSQCAALYQDMRHGVVHHCVMATGLRSHAGTTLAAPGKCIPSRSGLMRWAACVGGTSWISRGVQQGVPSLCGNDHLPATLAVRGAASCFGRTLQAEDPELGSSL